MELVAGGDFAAFDTLYEAHVRLVYGIAYRILNDEVAAEDVAQSVFLKVWTAPQAFRSGNFAAWIGRVTRNRALDELRRGSRTTSDLADFASDGSLDEGVIAHMDGERLRKLVMTLPAEQRRYIELAFFDGLTHRQIAAHTGTPLGTVKTKIRAGLAAIRSAFTPSRVR